MSRFPIEIQVHLPNGTIVTHHNLNEVLFGDRENMDNEDQDYGG
jgi:hypothetical protein